MNNTGLMSVSYLMERAAQCRLLARQARSRGIATELERLAIDYDRDVAQLEVLGTRQASAFVQ
jgi:hypothetical protein